MTAAYAATAEAKQGAVADYIATLLQNGSGKLLVFAHHHVMLDGLEVRATAAHLALTRLRAPC